MKAPIEKCYVGNEKASEGIPVIHFQYSPSFICDCECGKKCDETSCEECRDNAKRLALCWNEHDKLKAKADSHDKLISALETIAGMCTCIISDIEKRVKNIAEEAIAEAKL